MMSKIPFYLSIPVYLTLTYVSGLLAWFKPEERSLWLYFALGTYLIAHLAMIVLVYRMWAAIQDGHARLRAGVAFFMALIPGVHLLFLIPLYWWFAADADRFIDRYRLPVHHIPVWLTLIFIALQYLSFIPQAWFVTAPLAISAVTILVSMCIDVVNVSIRHHNEITGDATAKAAVSGDMIAAPAPATVVSK